MQPEMWGLLHRKLSGQVHLDHPMVVPLADLCDRAVGADALAGQGFGLLTSDLGHARQDLAQQVEQLRALAGGERDRAPRPWSGSWTGTPDNPSAVSAVSAVSAMKASASAARAAQARLSWRAVWGSQWR
jgi:hypothetical protein